LTLLRRGRIPQVAVERNGFFQNRISHAFFTGGSPMIRHIPFVILLLSIMGIELSPTEVERFASSISGSDIPSWGVLGVVCALLFGLYLFRGFGNKGSNQSTTNVYRSEKRPGVWPAIKNFFGFSSAAHDPVKEIAQAIVTIAREAKTPEAAVAIVEGYIASGKLINRAGEYAISNAVADLADSKGWQADRSDPLKQVSVETVNQTTEPAQNPKALSFKRNEKKA